MHYLCTRTRSILIIKTITMTTELTRVWNNLDKDDKLEIIEKGIDMCDTSEGFLMLRLFRKGNSISAFISNSLDNHLSVEAVSKDTLIELFGVNHNYQEKDAEIILNWMNNQK